MDKSDNSCNYFNINHNCNRFLMKWLKNVERNWWIVKWILNLLEIKFDNRESKMSIFIFFRLNVTTILFLFHNNFQLLLLLITTNFIT